MKREEITVYNIDEYIREKKKNGFKINKPVKRMFWNKKQAKIFYEFAKDVLFDLSCAIPPKFPDKCNFMGIKHFIKKD